MRAAFALADRHYVLSKGQVCFSGKTAQLDGNESVMREYLGM
jgi:ABC-type branched-subunit amino acid transport system ATPase component